MRITGIDLSMTATGYATLTVSEEWMHHDLTWHLSTIGTKGTNDDPLPVTYDRLRRIVAAILESLRFEEPDLVVLEGPAFSSSSGKAHDRSGLWWLLYDGLRRQNAPVAVVKPNTRAMYATGKGTASKDAVLAAAVRRYADAAISNNNEADAVVLAAMGARWCEYPIEASLPMTHLRAMTAPEWPEAAAATPISR